VPAATSLVSALHTHGPTRNHDSKKEKCIDEITTLLAKEITPKLNTLCTEHHSFIQYQKASAELEHLAHVLCTYEWLDHCAKALCKDAQIAEREQDIVQVYCEKGHTMCEAGITEKNWVDLQMQHDCKLKKGGNVTSMEEEAKELEMVVIKLHT
jgi:structural maintenance of chromosome 2